MDNEVELTELYDLQVERHDGVASPASGFSFLVTKSARQYAPGTCDCCPHCEGATGKGDCCEACKFTPGPVPTTNEGTPNGVGKADMATEATEPAEKAEEVEETSEAPAEKAEAPAALTEDSVQELIKAALAERDSVAESLRKELAEAKSALDVLKATPIPGGPAISATAEQRAVKAKTEAMQKAAYFKRLAETVQDRELAVEYTKRAKAAEAEAA